MVYVIQRNCPKHVEFYSKNKFEKLVHLVDFITRIYHDARSLESQIQVLVLITKYTAYTLYNIHVSLPNIIFFNFVYTTFP